MANLTFPSNPTNGQKVTLGDKVFVYSNTTSRWTATKLNVFGNLTGDFTIAPPELNLSNNTVALIQQVKRSTLHTQSIKMSRHQLLTTVLQTVRMQT
jgi:hypothetical protein